MLYMYCLHASLHAFAFSNLCLHCLCTSLCDSIFLFPFILVTFPFVPDFFHMFLSFTVVQDGFGNLSPCQQLSYFIVSLFIHTIHTAVYLANVWQESDHVFFLVFKVVILFYTTENIFCLFPLHMCLLLI